MITAAPCRGGLAVDAMRGPRQRLEAARRDRLAAVDAGPEGAVVEPGERGIDQRQLLLRAVAQGEVALLLEDLDAAAACDPYVIWPGAWIASPSRRAARALGLERGTRIGRVDGRHRPTVRPET